MARLDRQWNMDLFSGGRRRKIANHHPGRCETPRALRMLFVRRYGDSGPFLLILHGGPGAPGYVAPIGRALSDTYRVLEPFQRESGSDPLTVAIHVEDLYEVARSCGGDLRPALLGSSWGAMLALAYAAAHPDSAGPLILVGCGTFDAAARSRMHAILEERTTEAVRQRMRQASLIPDEDERMRVLAEVEMALYSYQPVGSLEGESFDARAHRETWEDMLSLQARGVYPAAFASITCPVLMVHGDFDPHPGRLIRDSLLPYLPQLDYVELEDCGHYPWLERVAAAPFLSLVREWLWKRSTRCPVHRAT